MSSIYRKHYSQRATPQSEALPGQVPNSAGGHAYPVDDWVRLRRFLILGTEGGTYYIGERKLTRDAAKAVERCWAADPERTLREIVEVSDGGLAKQNDPALFALALGAAGTPQARGLALGALGKVARIGTHLFHFVDYVQAQRGWGRGLRRAVSRWYGEMPVDKLALQVVKYRQRDGWSHRDLLWKAHVKASCLQKAAVYDWLFAKEGEPVKTEYLPQLVQDYLHLQARMADKLPASSVAQLLSASGLPWEAVADEYINEPDVLRALLPSMGMTALIRQLGRLTKAGVLTPMSELTLGVAQRLRNVEELRKGRIHPLQCLIAGAAYGSQPGALMEIREALQDAFQLAFQTVEPSNKRLMLALDVSGSMTAGRVAGTPLTPNVAAAAMLTVTMATEPLVYPMAFADTFRPLPITRKDSLQEVMRKTSGLSFGRTDCSLPMVHALKEGIQVDGFVVYTDNETWAGRIHPVEALWEYRRKTGIPAKLIVVGMVANEFSIADPSDAGMLDVVGFDASAPAAMANFLRGAF